MNTSDARILYPWFLQLAHDLSCDIELPGGPGGCALDVVVEAELLARMAGALDLGPAPARRFEALAVAMAEHSPSVLRLAEVAVAALRDEPVPACPAEISAEALALALRRRSTRYTGFVGTEHPMETADEERVRLRREQEDCRARAVTAMERRRRTRPHEASRERAYVQGALDRAVLAVLACPPGGRRSTLNRESFAIGGFVGGGLLDAELARAALVEAGLAVGLDSRRVQATVRAALAQGATHPRVVPDAAPLRSARRGGRIPTSLPGEGTGAV